VYACRPRGTVHFSYCVKRRTGYARGETINQNFLRIRKNSGWVNGRVRGTGTGNGDCVRCIPHNYFRLLDLSDISSVAATDSLQLLLLVTLAKLGTRVKFCSCREVLEGFAMGRGREDRKGWMSKERRVRGWGLNGEGVGNRKRAERTSTYVIRFAPLRRNCLNFPSISRHHTHSRTYHKLVDNQWK